MVLRSQLLSGVLAISLLGLWIEMNDHEPPENQLVDNADVDAQLECYQASGDTITTRIPTGIFVQSLNFNNSSDVNLTGYVWQKYDDTIADRFIPKNGVFPLVFPEQIDSGSDIVPRLAYTRKTEAEHVVGWYFEATLRQPFEYGYYPFDHKTVWVRLWPSEFYGDVVLVPDLEAYDSTSKKDVFGIEKDLVLGDFYRANTYFDFKPATYSTDFGLSEYVGQTEFPELHYNIVIKRKLLNAFLVHLLPISFVLILIYAALIKLGQVQNKEGSFGISGVIGTCLSLLAIFVVLHTQLRNTFPDAAIVYLEYFYILLYGLLAGLSAYAVVCMPRQDGESTAHHLKAIKLGYWPVVLGFLVVVTVGVIWGESVGTESHECRHVSALTEGL